jgi:tetratricopeptide (TPR) repeat protein
MNAVEACQALYREGRHAEVLRRVASHVSVAQGAEPYETALLWTLAALAHEAIGEPDEARAAYDAATWIMPDARAPVPAWLGDAGGALLRWLVAPVRTGHEAPQPSGARLHLSLSWLRALGASGTEDARGAIAEVGEGLWAESARHANALLSQQDFQAVRELAQEALAYGALPPGRQEEFRELASMGLAAEIGRLMSRALERLDSPDEALAALDRGEAALRSVPVDLVENRQRQELERRLWWGYTRLGLQRLDAGAAEEAVALFFRGLPLAEPDPERCSETRQALVRALEAWAARVREVAAGELAGGDRDAAAGEVRRLRESLRRGVELGLLEADAAGAIAASEGLRELGEEA